MKKVILALSFITLFGSACSKNNSSQVKIDSGTRILPGDTDIISAVVNINGCTATTVSDTTLLTAGHCIKSSQVCVVSPAAALPDGKSVCSSSVFVTPEYLSSSLMTTDIAVVVFPKGTFKYFFPVSGTKLEINENVLLVGYSSLLTNAADPAVKDKDQNGAKRWGKNFVSSYENDAGYFTTFKNSTDGVAVSPGDSGGPIFSRSCEINGVASRMTFDNPKRSIHTSTAFNLKWLVQQEANGAYFCGISFSDADRCAGIKYVPIQDDGQTSDGRPIFPCGVNGKNGTGNNNNSNNNDKANNNGGISDSDIKIKMHETALSDSPMAFFSVAKQVTYIEICETTSIDECTSSNSSYKKVTSGFALGSRKAKYTQMRAAKADGVKNFVVIARDNSDTVVASRTFNLKSN